MKKCFLVFTMLFLSLILCLSTYAEQESLALCGGILLCGTDNKLLDLDFQNANILSVFKVLAQESGCNMVIDPSVQGQITIQAKEVPWLQVFTLILKTYSLSCEISKNIIRIVPTEKLDEERGRSWKRNIE